MKSLSLTLATILSIVRGTSGYASLNTTSVDSTMPLRFGHNSKSVISSFLDCTRLATLEGICSSEALAATSHERDTWQQFLIKWIDGTKLRICTSSSSGMLVS